MGTGTVLLTIQNLKCELSVTVPTVPGTTIPMSVHKQEHGGKDVMDSLLHPILLITAVLPKTELIFQTIFFPSGSVQCFRCIFTRAPELKTARRPQ